MRGGQRGARDPDRRIQSAYGVGRAQGNEDAPVGAHRRKTMFEPVTSKHAKTVGR